MRRWNPERGLCDRLSYATVSRCWTIRSCRAARDELAVKVFQGPDDQAVGLPAYQAGDDRARVAMTGTAGMCYVMRLSQR